MASKSLLSESLDYYVKAVVDNRTRRNAKKTIEYEIRFTPNYRDGDAPINVVQFNRVMRSLLAHGFKIDNSGHQMKVIPSYVNEKGYTKQSRTRVEISNLFGIQQLCQTNNIPENSKYVTKKFYDFGIEGLNPFMNKDFMFRASIQSEEERSQTDTEVVSMNREWGDSLKMFRYIHRMSFTHDKMKNIRVDMSKVKSNFKNLKRTFSEAQVLEKKEVYEIEIEVIDKEAIDKDSILNELKKTIKYICGGLQNSMFPVSFKTVENVRTQYYNMIDAAIPKRNISKTFIGPSSYTLQKVNLVRSEEQGGNSPAHICIEDEFCVTDKADGERNMMLVSSNGSCFFINTNLEFVYTGFSVKNTKLYNSLVDGEFIKYDKYGNQINVYAMFDIYFLNNRDLRKLPFYSNEEIDAKQKMRYKLLNTFCNNLSLPEQQKYDSMVNKINFEVKYFAFSIKEDRSSIYKVTKLLLSRINSNTYIYNTDGLIYTSKTLGVTQESLGSEIKNYKYSWRHSFKWKPPRYNTIDFLIKIQKNNGEVQKYAKHVDGEIVNYAIAYLYVGLNKKFDGNMASQKTILNLEFENREQDQSRDKNYEPTLFYPTNPYDDQAHICHILMKVDDAGSLTMYTEENEIIEDDTIVEFSYNNESNDKYLSWTPLRVRYDKTSEYRNGGNNFGNSYNVANSNWKTIKDPISEDMLISNPNLTMENILLQDKDVYYNGDKKHSKTKSLRNFHNLYVKNALIGFASKKSRPQDRIKLLDLAVGKAGDLSKWAIHDVYAVLGIDIAYDNIHNPNDGACSRYLDSIRDNTSNVPIGMFIHGDTSKLLETGEFSQPSAENSNGKVEFQEAYDENGEIIQEEVVKNDSYNILQSLMGVGTKESASYPFTKKNFGIFESKFDIVSIQFALHYMFENKRKLHSFLKNVADYTKLGKYFIGTCYDGKKIYQEMKEKKHGEKSELYVDGKKVWHCTKLYDDAGNMFMNDEETSLGYKIKVYQETINKDFEEYLVNFDYFIKVMSDYGFEVCEEVEINKKKQKGIANFEVLYETLKAEKSAHQYGEATKMRPEEKKISFLNNYFVFKKIRDVDTKLLYSYYVQENEVENKIDFEVGAPVKLGRKVKLSQV